VREELLAMPEGQLVDIVGDEALRHIGGGNGPRETEVVRIDVVGAAEAKTAARPAA
jgi:hypothetical protein